MAIIITHTKGPVVLADLLENCTNFEVLNPNRVMEIIQKNNLKSGVFSRQIAQVFSNQLGIDIPTRLFRLKANEGDSLLVGLLPTPPKDEWNITWVLFQFDKDDAMKNAPPTLH